MRNEGYNRVGLILTRILFFLILFGVPVVLITNFCISDQALAELNKVNNEARIFLITMNEFLHTLPGVIFGVLSWLFVILSIFQDGMQKNKK